MRLYPKRKGIRPQEETPIMQYMYPIEGSDIKAASIITQALKDGSIATAKIENLAVTTAKINTLAVTTAKIDNLAVDTAQIAALAVTEAKIGALAVTEAKIGALAVTNAKIGLLAVDTAQIAALGVTEAKIGALAVTNAKINDLDASKINAGYLSADRIEAGTITANKLSFTAFDTGSHTLDNVTDGTSYKRVLSAHLDAGKLQLLSTTTVDAGFTIDMIGEGSTNKYFNGKDLDDLGEGTTYQRVLATQISAGKISLTSTSFLVNEDNIIAGTPASTRCELTANGLRGYSDATLQFEISAADGKGYFGGGACVLDSSGLTLKGEWLNLQNSAGSLETSIYTDASGDLIISPEGTSPSPIIYLLSLSVQVPKLTPADSATDIGAAAGTFECVYSDALAIKERATGPSDEDTIGKFWTKSDNLLYFTSGDGVDHTVAYV